MQQPLVSPVFERRLLQERRLGRGFQGSCGAAQVQRESDQRRSERSNQILQDTRPAEKSKQENGRADGAGARPSPLLHHSCCVTELQPRRRELAASLGRQLLLLPGWEGEIAITR